ncbi:MAG: hypothetical protein ACYCUI_16435, partial [Vulcanimicrobiaceae bacterium]
MDAVAMGDWDSGVIQDCTIYGGSISVQFGPWSIVGNDVLGAVLNSVSDAAFAVNGGHDITISGNTVEDQNPSSNGYILRFVTLNGGGYDFTIQDNLVTDGVGLPAPDAGVSLPSSNEKSFANAPEVILPEGYSTTFEGSTSELAVGPSTGVNADTIIGVPSAWLFSSFVNATSGSAGRL